MSVSTTGTLEIVKQRDGTHKVEHWNTGGEIAYSITGGHSYDVTPVGDKWKHYRWTAKFRRRGRTLQVGFMQGTGLPGVPDAARVLASAFEDAASVEWEAFEGWAYDLGYQSHIPDQWKRAKRIYNACERMGARLERFIPNDTEREVWAEALSEVGR